MKDTNEEERGMYTCAHTETLRVNTVRRRRGDTDSETGALRRDTYRNTETLRIHTVRPRLGDTDSETGGVKP